ncbi:exonuclease RecJ [Magnetococcus marinus MC-1]|uniref:Single-stranded-DNA-specific exonuclease RecJ n=1 Tax=Magnetococcus marinus (strain ATCC BAA-1437 / JCM 17883 / MC-1) TaxID=156889 RepID=A0L8H3_MAGMM|nr:single-stranded-DNA-specific exonuclease RecJ [Magnetococcus marinus]ABK44266.1 exonuclease RecJ [Magnetococcus marinus MC-1]
MGAAAKSSLTGKLWTLRCQPDEGHNRVVQALGLSHYLAPLLASRKLCGAGETRQFLAPRLKDLADPYDLLDMRVAVERLAEALERGEKIAVFGDYDVDGATSSALLMRYFHELGVALRVYIPNRLTEGYGPSVGAMRTLAEEGVSLVITVDCGITAFEPLQEAKALGLAVIITDHHQAREQLPEALAVINPNRQDEPFPYKELAGVGVAFYLVMALNRLLRERGWFNKGRQEPVLKPLLDLVAVGTVADVAGMRGLNRALVTTGLHVLSERSNPGLAALMQVVGIGEEVKELTSTHIGFQLGPRLNAGGRLGQGALGYQLLSCHDQAQALPIAQTLDASNKERQEIERTLLKQAMDQVEAENQPILRRGLVVAGEGWHAGVIGIVASRLCDKYSKPALVIAIDAETGVGKGSGRSIPGINLLAAIEAGAAHLEHFGGHKVAAGLTIQREKIPAFMEAFEDHLTRHYQASAFFPRLTVDAELPLDELDFAVARQIQSFSPFGPGNPEPIFILPRVSLRGIKVLKERHLAMSIVCPRTHQQIEAIGFRMAPGPIVDAIQAGDVAVWDVAGKLTIETWRGREKMKLQLSDVRAAG